MIIAGTRERPTTWTSGSGCTSASGRLHQLGGPSLGPCEHPYSWSAFVLIGDPR
jgi:hypothetical protein